MNSILIAVGFIALSWVILFVSAVIVTRFLRRREVRWVGLINTTIGWLAATACVVVAVTPSFVYEFVSPDGTYKLARQENGHLVFSEDGYGLWEGEGCCIIVPNFGLSGTGTITALTENPKIRITHYNLDIFIIDPEKYYLSKPARQKLGDLTKHRSTGRHFKMSDYSVSREPYSVYHDIGLIASSLMYEFNDKHSKQVVQFFNPLDAKQNEDFKVLIESWMNERLAPDGLQAVFTSFKVD